MEDIQIGMRAGLWRPDFKTRLYEFFSSLFTPTIVYQAIIQRDVIVTDVSFYQSVIDFNKMKSNGGRGTIIRAGQNTWKDTSFNSHWSKSRDAGLPRGSYWFFDSRSEPERQADLWTSIIAQDKGEMEHWADFEEAYGGAHGGWNGLYRLLARMKNNLPNLKLGVYTGYYYWLSHKPSNENSLNWFGQFPLWLAWYSDNPSVVKIPAPWTDLLYWQYTSHGDGPFYGVNTLNIDLNNFNGSINTFNTRYGIGVEPPPPEGEDMDKIVIQAEKNKIEAANNAITNLTSEIIAQQAVITESLEIIQTEIDDAPPPSTNKIAAVKVANLSVRVGPGTEYATTGDYLTLNQQVEVLEEVTIASGAIWVRHSLGWSAMKSASGATIYMEYL